MRAKQTLSGVEDQLERIAALAGGAGEAVDQALIAGADVALEGMQNRVPVDTGNLRDNLKRTEPVTDGNYHYIEVGLIDVDSKTAIYGAVQEHGSSSVEAQPYVRPTIDEDRGKIRAAQRAELNKFEAGAGGST